MYVFRYFCDFFFAAFYVPPFLYYYRLKITIFAVIVMRSGFPWRNFIFIFRSVWNSCWWHVHTIIHTNRAHILTPIGKSKSTKNYNKRNRERLEQRNTKLWIFYILYTFINFITLDEYRNNVANCWAITMNRRKWRQTHACVWQATSKLCKPNTHNEIM